MKKLEEYVRSIPDFPEPGIIFRDITTILQDPDGLHLAIDGILRDLEELILTWSWDLSQEALSLVFLLPMRFTKDLFR